MLIENGEDAQAQGRLTLAGHALPVPPADQEDAAQRYFRRFPHAQEYRQAHDFDLYRIEPVRVRYIGGFGQIHWLEPREVCLPNPFSAAVEGGMAAHMNEDHADALRNYCRMFGVEADRETPRLAAVDREGFDLMVGKRLLRIEFDAPVQSPDEVRKAMVALALRAREVGLQPA
jgi:putative heme iron utilization protein